MRKEGDRLRAKVYLRKIAFYDTRIESNNNRIKDYKDSAVSKTSNLSPNKVQSSSGMQKMESAVVSYSDLDRIVKSLEKKRQEIIDDICLLEPSESIVLYKKYVDGLELVEMEDVLKKSQSWIYKKHESGLKKIQEILDAREKVG